MKKVFVVIVMIIGLAGIAVAHSGGTDAYGCHTDHKTGIRHCH